MGCANCMTSSMDMVTVSGWLVPDEVEAVGEAAVTTWLPDMIGFGSDWVVMGSDLIGDSTTSELDWNEEMDDDVVSSWCNESINCRLLLSEVSLMVLVTEVEEIVAVVPRGWDILLMPWMFFKCLVRSPEKIIIILQSWHISKSTSNSRID